MQYPDHSTECSHQQGEGGAEQGGQRRQREEGGQAGGGAEEGGEGEVHDVGDQDHPQRVSRHKEAFTELDAGDKESITNITELDVGDN